MKKIIGIIVVILMIPVIISVIGDIDRTPIYPTTEFNIEKLTRISSLDIENNIELLKLPNGVGDRWLTDGNIERNVGKITVDNSMNWRFYGSQPATTVATFTLYVGITHIDFRDTNNAISSLFSQGYYFGVESEVFALRTNGELYISIKKSRIPDWDDEWTATQKVNVFKQWLQANPITVYYQLETPIIENAPTFPEFIDFYDGGSVIVDDGIIDYTIVGNQVRINYIEGNITTVEDGQFKISKPTKIISKSNDLYDYDLSTLPNYFEYGTLPQGTYDNVIEFINNNQNKQIKLFFNDNIQESRYNTYLENDTIIINNDTEVIRIYNNDTYTSTRNLDTDITYKLEGYNIIGYIDGKFDNTVLAFFWVIPVLLVGGLIYLLLKRKE